MFNEHDADAARKDGLHKAVYVLPLRRVKAGRRLIKQKQPRFDSQRARDFQAVLRPERQVARETVSGIRKPDQVQAFMGKFLSGLAPPWRSRAQELAQRATLLIAEGRDHDVFERCHIAEQAFVLERARKSQSDDPGVPGSGWTFRRRAHLPSSAR